MLSPQERDYSNTIELYDFIPKYVWGRIERVQDQFLHRLERGFECRNVNYTVKIDPAKVEDSDGVVRDYFPGKREELVEDALRKLATNGQGLFLDDEAAVTFTLYQLHQELKRTGHTYSIQELKNALMICVGTTVHITDSTGSTVFSNNLFEAVGLQTKEDWNGQGEKSKAFVRFNTLVTTSIRRRAFRQYNYEVAMSYRTVIARQLHKRMSHHYSQAHLAQPYAILLSTVIRDFGLTAYEKLSHNLRDVEKALEEMVESDVLFRYELQKIGCDRKKNKLSDVKIVLYPHQKFVAEVIAANRKLRETPQQQLA